MKNAANVLLFLEDNWLALPTMLGPDWPTLYPFLVQQIEKIGQEEDGFERGELVLELVERLQSYEVLRGPLQQRLSGGARNEREQGVDFSQALGTLRRTAAAEEHAWKLGIQYPALVPVGEYATVTVSFSLAHAELAEPCHFVSHETVTLTLSSEHPDLEVLEPQNAALRMIANKRVLSHTFHVFSQTNEPATLSLDIHSVGGWRGNRKLRFNDPSSVPPTNSRVTLGGHPLPADLEIRVSFNQDRGEQRLRYELRKNGGTNPIPAGSKRVENLETTVNALLDRLRSRRNHHNPTIEDLLLELRGLVFTKELTIEWDRFWSGCRNEQGKNPDWMPAIQVVSDEPWVPWELLPVPPKGRPVCQESNFSRWLTLTEQGPPMEIRLRRLVIVRDPDLREKESAALQEQFVNQKPEVQTGFRTVSAGIPLDLLHYVGHATARHLGNPKTMELLGYPDLPPQLEGAFVFLNACETGDLMVRSIEDHELPTLEGFASYCLRHRDVAAFVGTDWPVFNGVAATVSKTFYGYSVDKDGRGSGLPLSAALRKSRIGQHLDVLAYRFYGHPFCKFSQKP